MKPGFAPFFVRNTDTGIAIMVASLDVIAQAFGLHKDAVKRIELEVERDGISASIKRVRFEVLKYPDGV
jgi:hypothetical protein